jgi:type III secretion protein C
MNNWLEITRLIFIWLLLGMASTAFALTPNWIGTRYKYAAESKPLKDVLRDFASSQGMTLSMSSDIDGVVAGRFDLDPNAFITMLSRSYGFSWYYDGAVLHVLSAKDISSRVIKFSSAKIFELSEVLIRTEFSDKRFPIRFDAKTNMAFVVGPSPYVDLVADIAAHVEAKSAKLGNSEVRVFPLIHSNAADSQGEGTPQMPGVASLLSNVYKKNKPSVGETDTPKMYREQQRLLVGAEPLGSAGQSAQRRIQNSPSVDKSGAAWWDAQMKVLETKSPSSAQKTPTLSNEIKAISGAEMDLPIFIADAARNAVIVVDLPERMEAHKDLINKFDVRVPQVEIEIHILEIQREALEELGVNWQLDTAKLYGQSGTGKASQNGFNGPVPGGLLTAVVGNSGRYLLARINALQTKGLARVSARPKVATLNNHQATMSSEQIMHVKVEAFQSAQLYAITTGTVLSVTPNATFEGGAWQIKLDVHVKDGRVLDSQVSNIPLTTQNRIDTQAVVRHGESLLLGGSEVDTQSNKTLSIPGISNIPILGALFRQRSVSSSHFQRLFLVSPRILQ